MADELPAMTLKAIGIVRNGIKQKPPPGYDWGEVISEVVIENSLTEALDGLEEFSHIVVLFWFHQVASQQISLKIHPMGKEELPLTGLFATGTPNRPNRIGRTTVRLLQRQGNILKVKGLDAIDGTPVIDIKSYNSRYDSVTDTRVPPWVSNL